MVELVQGLNRPFAPRISPRPPPRRVQQPRATANGSGGAKASPTADKPEQKLTASERLRRLQERRKASMEELERVKSSTASKVSSVTKASTVTRAPGPPQTPSGAIGGQAAAARPRPAAGGVGFQGHRGVDIRMYEQVQRSQQRLSEQLSDAKRYAVFLEEDAEERMAEITMQSELLNAASQEVSALMRLAKRTADGAEFGVDPEAAAEDMRKLMARLEETEKILRETAKKSDNFRPRLVPITWVGVANDVKLMGDFDEWTRGIDLSAEELGDQVFMRFAGEVMLRPGEYQVKFLVDDEWRIAPEWPTVMDEEGNESNLLVVD
ncbi:unnamed protein product [Pedinophyceae sp. YPF-701]|nr:unnamed protein product [Pedinophyceae sp. YPF-701]